MSNQLLAAAIGLTLGLIGVPGRIQKDTDAEQFLDRKERWAIKTGADPGAGRLDLIRPRPAKVADLIRLPRPRQLPENATNLQAQTTRYSEAEKTLYVVDADIVRYKLEKDDHDFHIVIRDHDDFHADDPPIESGDRRTMIVEIPDPAVVVASSPWRAMITGARQLFTDRLHPAARFTYKVVHARITGVGYFDFMHGQSGVARNGFELHPVLGVTVLDLTVAARPSATPVRARLGSVLFHRNPRVWVNTASGVFWRPNTRYYGKTKHGKYMSEQTALNAGYRPAHGQ